VVSDESMVMVSEDLKVIGSYNQKRSQFQKFRRSLAHMTKEVVVFCRMDSQEGACARIDYDGVHKVVVTDQICVRN
jgi:hypothetical protein